MIEILEKIKSGIISEVIIYSIVLFIALVMLALLIYMKRRDLTKYKDNGVKKMYLALCKFFAMIAVIILICFYIDRIGRINSISADIEKSSFISIDGEFSYSGEIEGRGFIKCKGDERRLIIVVDIFPNEIDYIKDNRVFNGEITYSEKSGYVTAISLYKDSADTNQSD